MRRAQRMGHKLVFLAQSAQNSDRQSRLVFGVEDLIKKKREVVHAQRLLLYREDCDGKRSRR